jgi:hypothetical protein
MTRPFSLPNRIASAQLLPALCLLLLFALSCKSKKHATAENTPPANTGCKVQFRLPKPLISDMHKSEFKFDWFAGRMDVEASDDSSRVTFDVFVRMRRDSAIWMNVLGPLNIKVARVLITKDSVRFVQYQDGTLSPQPRCFAGDFALLSQLLQTEVDYEMMQSLLIGNSVSFYEEDEKLKSSVNTDECNYTLSTIRKRKLKRVLEGQAPPSEPLQTISLDPQTFKIMKILFIDAQNRSFTATYDDFSKEDSLLFPHHAVFIAKGLQKTARVNMKYKHITLNQPQEFPFTIPDDCKPIIIEGPAQQEAPAPGQH